MRTERRNLKLAVQSLERKAYKLERRMEKLKAEYTRVREKIVDISAALEVKEVPDAVCSSGTPTA